MKSFAFVIASLACAGCLAPLPDAPPLGAELREAAAALEPQQAPSPASDRAPAPAPPSAHGSFSGFFESHFSSDAWRDDVVRDYLTAKPVLLPAALAAGALAVSPWDKDVQRNFQSKLGDTPAIGDFTLGVLLVGSVADGLLAPGPGRTATDEIWCQAEALGITAGLTEILKGTVHRHRPGDSSSGSSFPSGHASAAFAAATLIERNAGLELGIPAYALAALTGFSRIEAGRHFPSDVLAGAALGTLCAGALDALHFGTGREGKGIAGHPVAFEVTSDPERGVEVALNVGF
jgi:membrane-associated phospholipid phosphatase